MNTQDIKKRIELLEARNARVEADKAWEGSWQRKALIMVLAYVVVVCYLHFVVRIDPWISAIVPVLGFYLSGLTLKLAKKAWQRSHL